MLTKITLTNFRRHTNAEFNFGEGLSVLRGSNEIGKSTVIESIAYALFGVKALRSSLDEAVTWGQPVSTLKAVLIIDVDGVTYKVSRGKPGAECTYGGDGIVTGQNEVTNFMSRLLRVDETSATKLMLSTQLDIRGTLEAGPKAATELIEHLAEFDQIDHLIDLMQEKLTLGNTATAANNLEHAKVRLAQAGVVVEPDTKGLQALEVEALASVDLAKTAVASTRATLDDATASLVRVEAQSGERRRAASQLETAKMRRDQASSVKIKLETNPVVEPVDADGRIQRALAATTNLAQVREAVSAHEAVKDLLGVPAFNRTTTGGADGYQKTLWAAQSALEAARDAQRKGDVTYAALESKLNSGNCGFCGQDFSELPAVKEQNEKIQTAMCEALQEASAAGAMSATLKVEIASLQAIQTEGRPTINAAQKYAQYLEVNDSYYPPELAWKGAVPNLVGDQPDYAAEIAGVRRDMKAHTDYAAALRDATRDLTTTGDAVAELTEALAKLGEAIDPADAQQAKALAEAAWTEMRDVLDGMRSALNARSRNLTDATDQWARAQRESKSAREAVGLATAALKELEFNNALIKKVRAARPVIADKLWRLLLSTVSTYFSEMRGAQSKVTKDSEGFKVDGHPAGVLSGSTLDILGLAIRAALVRTFLPGATFLVLDEPAAGCDSDRTNAMLAFLTSTRFNQTILVTHEGASEAIADHVLLLGGVV